MEIIWFSVRTVCSGFTTHVLVLKKKRHKKLNVFICLQCAMMLFDKSDKSNDNAQSLIASQRITIDSDALIYM